MLYRTALANLSSCLQVAMMLGIFTKLSAAREPFCYGDSIFKRYTTKKTWAQARLTCQQEFEGDLAIVDTLDMAKKIQDNYPKSGSHYVGGKRAPGERFRWHDGTNLSRDILHYENGFGTNCLLFNMKDSSQQPSISSEDCNENKAFLCQRVSDKSPPVINDDVEMTSGTQQSITCKTDWCSPTWISEDDDEIPRCGSQLHRICQLISGTESRLRFNNASATDSGVYRCKTKNESSTSAVVKAIGQPEIRRIEKSSCSAITTLNWIASPYVINDTHIITLSDGQRFGAIARDSDTEQRLILTSLSPSTYYTLSLTACNKTCFPLFSPLTTNFTTNGIPNKVKRIYSVHVDASKCSIRWSLPWTSTGVSKYKIRMDGSAIAYRSNPPNNQSWDDEVERPLFEFKPRPNTRYTVSISAENCGGTGQSVAAIANCTLPSAAPESVSAPVIRRTGTPESPIMKILLSNESAGLISCILVLVTELPSPLPTVAISEDAYERDEFSSLFASNTTSNEYVATAISPNTFASKENMEFVVGDDSASACNISNTFTTDLPNIGTCGGDIICGRNSQLRNQTQYRTYVVVVVPFNNTFVSVRSSENVVFETITDNAENHDLIDNTSLVGIIVGVIIPVVTVSIIVVIMKRRSNRPEAPTSKYGHSFSEHPVYEEPSPIPMRTVYYENTTNSVQKLENEYDNVNDNVNLQGKGGRAAATTYEIVR